MRWRGYRLVSICTGLLILLLSSQALAVPVVTSEVTQLSGEVFRYSYTLTNPDDDLENIYDFGLPSFLGEPSNISSPIPCDPSDPFIPCWDIIWGWDSGTNLGFINWFSTDTSTDLLAGAGPLDFSFESYYLPREITFITIGVDALTGEIKDPAYGITVGPVEPSTSIPEPATLLLLSSGLAGIGLLRRRLFDRGHHC